MDKKDTNPVIDSLFKAGAHFGYSRTRRHPSIAPFIFGVKNRVEIFDLEKTYVLLDKAKEFVAKLGSENKVILFASGKAEAKESITLAAKALGMPYVAGRWIGGALTNFGQIKTRMERLERLRGERERGELAKYTKKERLLIDREIVKLETLFGGLLPLKEMPKALFVVDSKREIIAVTEAHKMGIPVIALLSTDCDLKDVNYPILGNDSSVTSIEFFVAEIVKAYKQGTALGIKK